MKEYINCEVKEGIAYVSFFHPKGNCFPSNQLHLLRKTFEKLSTDNSVKVIVLQNEGEKVFCAGASFDELLSINHFEESKQFFSGFGNLILSMKNCPKLIIGLVKGKAVGGGVGIISACDYVYATSVSDIKLSEISIGIGPFVIEPAVSKKIGQNGFVELCLTPTEWKNANWAKEKGLFNRVFENSEEATNKAFKHAEQLKNYSLVSMSTLKKIYWKDTDNWEQLLDERAELSGELALSTETKNALKRFKEKK